MASDRFAAGLAFVLAWEGGYSNDPRDAGGATNKGITQVTYSGWLKAQGLPDRPVRDITPDQVQAIYRQRYWVAAGCDRLPAPVDLCVFDFGVNAGVNRAVRYLQMALHITPDGALGPVTLAAASEADPKPLAAHLLDLREDYYRQLVAAKRDQRVYLAGWLNRVAALRNTITSPPKESP